MMLMSCAMQVQMRVCVVQSLAAIASSSVAYVPAPLPEDWDAEE